MRSQLRRGFNTPLCHSTVSYREQGKMCITILFVVREHVCDKYRQTGRCCGNPWLEECLPGLGLSYRVFLCVVMLWQPLCLTRWEDWGVLFQPIHTPFPASRILNELVQGTAIWLLCLRLHCLNSL